MIYLNEFDPYAAAWMRLLIANRQLARGMVDGRSIADVEPTDVVGYRRCHFFAGVAGWELALQLAGWPESWECWTGSCPCQPFSAAGKRKGAYDERHLWPEFFRLIDACRPACVFGEQVASKDALAWLDGVFADLEGAGYACWAADLCAAGVNAPHIRQRLFWVADASGAGFPQRECDGRVQRGAGFPLAGQAAELRGPWFDSQFIPCRDGKQRRISLESCDEPLAVGIPRDVGPLVAALERLGIGAADAKRIIKHARKNRVGRLKAYGNAIVPQLAAVFVRSVMEAIEELCQ